MYELREESAGHAHLICRACGTVAHPRDLEVAASRAQLATASGHADVRLDAVARGLCPRCAPARGEPGGPVGRERSRSPSRAPAPV